MVPFFAIACHPQVSKEGRPIVKTSDRLGGRSRVPLGEETHYLEILVQASNHRFLLNIAIYLHI